MKQFFRSIACWFATQRALSQAESAFDPAPLVALLRKYPEASVRVLAQARSHQQGGAVWIAVIFGVALAEAEPEGALPFLKELLAHVPHGNVPAIPWTNLSAAHATVIVCYLARQATSVEVGDFLLNLKLEQLKAIQPANTDWWRHLWVAAVAAQRMLHETLADHELLRAADLLRRSPSVGWIMVLKKTWLELAVRVRDEYTGNTARSAWIDRGPRTQLELAAGAVLSALGACAAVAASFPSFDRDEEHSRGLSEDIQARRRKYEYYKGLKEQYRSKAVDDQRQRTSVDDELVAEIRRTGAQLEELDKRITDAQQHESDHSTGYLLWGIVRQEQRYPTGVRQGAAWGLHHMNRECPAPTPTKTRVVAALRDAVSDEDNPDFRERRIQLLPGQAVEELAAALHDGLCWMVDLAEGEYRPAEKRAAPWAIPTEKELQHSMLLMAELMPAALAFLTEYPLRLMTLDDHRATLGKYVRDGCHWMFWTRYQGEYHTGTVTAREMCLIDRSGPNSMGIYFRLFAHPLLALPVIYHESMHYGGPSGMVQFGIASEANVWLRELLFARHLLARLADPVPNEQLPAFETAILDVLKQTRMQSLLLDWLCPIEDDEAWRVFNTNIENTYGKPLSPEQADERVYLYFLNQDVEIQFINDIEARFWCPEILWKDLDHPDTAELRQAFVRVLFNRWQYSHTLTPHERDQILAEPGCQAMQAAWDAFIQRRHAGETLRDARAELDLTPAQADALTVRRFDFEPEILRIQLIAEARRNLAAILTLLEELEQLPATAPLEPDALAQYNGTLQHHQAEIERLQSENELLLSDAMQHGRLERIATIFAYQHIDLRGRYVAVLAARRLSAEEQGGVSSPS